MNKWIDDIAAMYAYKKKESLKNFKLENRLPRRTRRKRRRRRRRKI